MEKIADDILAIMTRGTFVGEVFRLPPEVLDRPTYTEVNKVLEAAGGKWTRSVKGHVFDGDAEDALDPVIMTGEYTNRKQDFGQFDTPERIAEMAADRARIRPGMTLLEPSCGIGNLVLAAEKRGAKVTGVEFDDKRNFKAMNRCKLYGGIYLQDFLLTDPVKTWAGIKFAGCLMNPPFAKKMDLAHVEHAFKFVEEGGTLVAIMGSSVTFRQDARTVAFRELVARHAGSIEVLPKDSFKEAGTSVNTALVTMVR